MAAVRLAGKQAGIQPGKIRTAHNEVPESDGRHSHPRGRHASSVGRTGFSLVVKKFLLPSQEPARSFVNPEVQMQSLIEVAGILWVT